MPSQQQLMSVIRIQTEVARLGADLGAVMAAVADATLDLVAADGAAIELAEGSEMVYRAAAGVARTALGLRLDRDSSLSGLSVRLGETLCCVDTETDPRVNREACRKVGIRSMIVMPLRHGDATVGVLKAMSAQPDRFGEADMQLLDLLSGLVGAAMFYAAKYDTEALFYKATHDAMTDLANRSLFMDRLRATVQRSQREPTVSGVLVADMNGLKRANDEFGHRVGDAVIVEFAQRLRKVSRKSDTVARLGGDEFGLILTPLETRSDLGIVVARLEAELAAPFAFEDRQLPLSASIGAALVPDDGSDAEKVVEIADLRMYETKRASRQPS